MVELGVSKQTLRFTAGTADVYTEGFDVELDAAALASEPES